MTRETSITRYLYLLLVLTSHAFAQISIWPQPGFVSAGSENTWLSDSIGVTFECEGHVTFNYFPSDDQNLLSRQGSAATWLGQDIGHLSNAESSQDASSEIVILNRAVQRAIDAIFGTSFVPWKFHPRGSHFEPQSVNNVTYLETLVIKQSQCAVSRRVETREFFDGDESYRLVTTQNEINVESNSTIGTLRALETLKQLFYRSEEGKVYASNIPIIIEDHPKWSHRGLSLDIARNVIGVKEVIHTIDAMSTVKFSRLHLHATDSQSWPLDIPSLPDLALKGAYRKDQIWTANDLKRVQQHGLERGISVFIEIDSPGHTASIAHAYPDLIAAYNELDWDTFAAEPLSGQLKLDSPEVKKFFQTLLDDLLPRVSRLTHLYHLGGDEVNTNVHLLDETVRSNSSKVLRPLLQKFMSSVVNNALLHGLQPIVWEEMILDWNLTLPKSRSGREKTDTLVQVWRDTKRISEVLERGHRVIFGDHRHWYLDCGFGIGFLDPYPEGASPSGVPYNTSGGFPSKLKPPYLDYCNPFHNWRDIFVYNPIAGIDPKKEFLIEGGEVLLWSEQTDSIDLDFKLWPRAAAAAEVLWSGPRRESMLQDASRRLAQWRERVVHDLDVRSSPVHMTYCLMQEGNCNL